MNWDGIHIVSTYDRPDSIILAETISKPKRPTRSTVRPDRTAFAVGPGIIPLAATDEGGVRDSTAMATQAEIDAQATRDRGSPVSPVPLEPPALSRQTAEVPSQMPFIHSRLDFAPFAASAYEGVDNRENFMSDFTGKDAYYSYSRPNSNQEVAVYQGNDGSVVFAVRGTATTGDAKTDASILSGNPLKTPRFRRNIQTIDRIATMLGTPKDKIIVTGHSLGGSIAAAAAVALGVKAVTYNAGFSPVSILRDPYAISGKYRAADITNYVVPGDLVSFSGSMIPMLPETHTIERTATGTDLTAPHKMSNFLNQLGDFKSTRGDLYAPGKRTEGRTANVADGWINVPTKVPAHRKKKTKFTGGFGQPLPTPPTLWEILTGREPPKPIDDANKAAQTAGNTRDLINLLRPPRLTIPRFGNTIDDPLPYPELDLGPDEPLTIEEGIEDIIGLGETAAELGLLP